MHVGAGAHADVGVHVGAGAHVGAGVGVGALVDGIAPGAAALALNRDGIVLYPAGVGPGRVLRSGFAIGAPAAGHGDGCGPYHSKGGLPIQGSMMMPAGGTPAPAVCQLAPTLSHRPGPVA